jgi:hypothetical protein
MMKPSVVDQYYARGAAKFGITRSAEPAQSTRLRHSSPARVRHLLWRNDLMGNQGGESGDAP